VAHAENGAGRPAGENSRLCASQINETGLLVEGPDGVRARRARPKTAEKFTPVSPDERQRAHQAESDCTASAAFGHHTRPRPSGNQCW
jgi:hypothetical protein